jgi:hypothetical protein
VADPPIPPGWTFCCSCAHERELHAEVFRDRLGYVAAVKMGITESNAERAYECTHPDSPVYEKLTNAFRERWGCTYYLLRRKVDADPKL